MDNNNNDEIIYVDAERLDIPKTPQPVEKPKASVEDISNIARVTKEDILGKLDGNSEPNAFDFTEETEMPDDIVKITDQDVDDLFGLDDVTPGMPAQGIPKRRKVRFIRTSKQYPNNYTTLGGIR